MPVRGSRLDHLILLIAFPGLILLALVVEKTALAPRRAARPTEQDVEIWRSFAAQHPQFGAAQVRLADAELKAGDRAAAIEAYQRALELAPDLQGAALGLSQLHRDAGDHRAAIAVLEPFVAKQTGCLECLQNLAADYLALGDLERAASYIERVTSSAVYLPSVSNSNFSFGRARLLAGRIDEARGQLDAAVDHYQAALRYDPRLVGAHLLLGHVLLARAPRAALAHLEAYRAANPGDLRGALSLAEAYGDLGDEVAARRVLEEVRAGAAQRPPAQRRQLDLDAETQLAALEMRRGDLEAARSRLEAVLARDPGHAAARAQLADVRQRLAAQP
jgi:tetratricopeptide (TPR) repeat protein